MLSPLLTLFVRLWRPNPRISIINSRGKVIRAAFTKKVLRILYTDFFRSRKFLSSLLDNFEVGSPQLMLLSQAMS